MLLRIISVCIVLAAPVWAATGNLERAQNLYMHTDYAGAIRLLSASSSDVAELKLLGQCLFHAEDLKHATEVLEKAAALAPNDSAIQLWLGRTYGRRAETSFALLAVSLAGHTREAFEKAVKLDPMNRDAVNDLFEFYLQAPAFMGGGVEKARGLMPVLDRADPAEAWQARARLYEQEKQYESAEAAIYHAIEMEPGNTGQIMNMARFLERRGRHMESDEWSDRAAKIAPASPALLFARAAIWVHSKRRLEDARALLKKYIALDSLTPEDPSRADAIKLFERAGGQKSDIAPARRATAR